jgi:NAD(P)-dependent dehydrogenase (short-subunit alcohol dehydrogenase family)
MSRLDGKIAIVTGGAGSGIGHGISVALGKEGAFVAILEIDRVSCIINVFTNRQGCCIPD